MSLLGVREFQSGYGSLIIIAFISLLAILLAPILLIRFRKRWVAAFNLAATTELRVDSPTDCRASASLRTQVQSQAGLAHTSECFSSAGGISDCAHL
jgi:hypothetical protein